MTVPNYRGVYGRLMTVEALAALAPDEGVGEVRAYPAGRISPWQTNLR